MKIQIDLTRKDLLMSGDEEFQKRKEMQNERRARLKGTKRKEGNKKWYKTLMVNQAAQFTKEYEQRKRRRLRKYKTTSRKNSP
ncbi:hypothetical protein H5410_030596 [Solanum commersonii]|uniref:Uncharacterized protein n=1 Tax=Solanum commersonii TaxID=4109 RepID=A0A9J5YG30_SOLCO|nr:hypothetical protein H5410_030596 [Solanum commersonii]